MQFPAYVHSVVAEADASAWPVQGQGLNECNFTSTANALNLLAGTRRYDKDEFIREAGLLFQPKLGGTLPPIRVWQLRRRGYGTHFGNLAHTDADRILRGLIDMHVPVLVDIYPGPHIGSFSVYGQHATVLVGYSDRFTDAGGTAHEEYYLIDAQWPALGQFALASNDVDRNGDGVPELYPGNRSLERSEFMQIWTSRNYCPVFRTQEEHDAWYRATIRRTPGLPFLGWLTDPVLFGSDDRLPA